MKKKITIVYMCVATIISSSLLAFNYNMNKIDKQKSIKTVATIYTNSKDFYPSIKNNIVVEKKDDVKTTIEEQPVIKIEEKVIKKEVIPEKVEVKEEILEPTKKIVYDGMTLEELGTKLDKSLNSTIAGKGYLIASYSLDLGVDPYLATAIILQETGCKWTCSSLVVNCNNVGGQKGGPSCNGGAYKSYPTLEDGIRGYLDNLYNKYITLGLTTPETINPKYASDTNWKNKINNYISTIKEAK